MCKEKIYIIGMAKSSLSLKGGCVRNLELDVLRILNCIEKATEQDKNIIGYMLVYDDAVKQRIEKWLPNYNFAYRDKLKIETFKGKFSKDKIEIIFAEKAENAKWANSVANKSKKLTEDLLKKIICDDMHNLGFEIDNEQIELPINIQWDFCGIFKQLKH